MVVVLVVLVELVLVVMAVAVVVVAVVALIYPYPEDQRKLLVSFTLRLDETKQLWRCQNLCSSPNTQELLLEIYLNLKCSDAVHG